MGHTTLSKHGNLNYSYMFNSKKIDKNVATNLLNELKGERHTDFYLRDYQFHD